MKKFCIFCGEKPNSKTKEHIIPQWLINLTGEPNRAINLGLDFDSYEKTGNLKLRTFSFKSFHFPACEKCNSEFSNLENKVRSHILKVLKSDFLSNTEIDELLDWFDKVRIGLWLGSISLDGQFENVSPKFYIKTRISRRDRCLLVYEMEKSDVKGIQFIGTHSPLFQFNPSCFALRINNLYFFNISYDFLFSKNIGFPYPDSIAFTNEKERHLQVEMAKGKEKISYPLIKNKFIKPSISIYQPIMAAEIDDSFANDLYFDNKYVVENSLDIQRRKGAIFYVDKRLKKLRDEDELCLTNGEITHNSNQLPRKLAKQVFDTLKSFIKDIPSDSLLTNQEKQILNENKLFILKAQKDFEKIGQF